MKKCYKCKEIKSNESFGKDNSRYDSLQTACKDCKKDLNKTYKAKNRDKLRANKNARKAKRRAKKLERTPSWLSKSQKEETKLLYRRASFKCWKAEMQVDHIVPLQGKTVSGLHVPWNLQLLTKEENLRKFNKLEV